MNDSNTTTNDAPAEGLDVLKTQLQAAEQARDEYLGQAKRARADFENYQKRAARDQAQEKKYAVAALAADLLPALDNLDRATAAAEKAGETGPLVQGVALVHAMLLDVFRRHGIVRIEAQDQPFDPNLHQAVMQMPASDKPPMTVVQVLENGYMLHDRVLRPARTRGARHELARLAGAASSLGSSSRKLAAKLKEPTIMPTYEYVCQACGHTFEELQSYSEPLLTKCPACKKKKLQRSFGTGAAILFKGSGFYQTDYRSDSYTSAAKADTEAAKPAATDSKADKPAAVATESKGADQKSETKSPKSGK